MDATTPTEESLPEPEMAGQCSFWATGSKAIDELIQHHQALGGDVVWEADGSVILLP